MSLQLWLPLDGTLQNNGVNNDITITSDCDIFAIGHNGLCCDMSNNETITISNINCNIQQCSLELWINNSIEPSSQQLIYELLDNNNNIISSLYNNSVGLILTYNNASTTIPNSYLKSNIWNHIGIIYNNGNISIYLNNIALITINEINNKYEIKTMIVYSTNENCVQYNDIKLYDNVISGSTLKQDYQSLYLHYQFQNSNESIEYDTSGHGHNLMVAGSATAGAQSHIRYNNHITFSSTSSYSYKFQAITPILTYGNQNIKHDYTISFWCYLATDNPNKNIVSIGNQLIIYQDTNYYLCCQTNQSNLISSVIKLSNYLNQWIHIVIIFENGQYYFVINNIKHTTISTINTNTIFNSNITFIDSTNSCLQNGSISDFRLYMTALNDKDIQQLYETSAVFTKNGINKAYSFIENSTTKKPIINKQGVWQTTELIEIQEEKNRIYKDGHLESYGFYEF